MNSIENILQRTDTWQPHAKQTPRQGLSTGFTDLDNALGIGGWPQGATTELLINNTSISGIDLLLPTLSTLSRSARWLVLISPPHIPYAPALAAYGVDLSRLLIIQPHTEKDRLWATEQALKSGSCSLVISWEETLTGKYLRRLQLAAKEGQCWHIQFRSQHAGEQTSPAALRLKLSFSHQNIQVTIIKQRQSWSGKTLYLPLPDILSTQALSPRQLPVPSCQQITPEATTLKGSTTKTHKTRSCIQSASAAPLQ